MMFLTNVTMGLVWRTLSRPVQSAAGVTAVLMLIAVGPAGAAPRGSLAQPKGNAGCFQQLGVGGCASARAMQSPRSVAVSPDARNVYVASGSSNAVAVFARNVRRGGLRQLKGEAGCVSHRGGGPCAFARALAGASSVVVSPDGANVYVAANNSSALAAFARNKRTGRLRQLSGSAGCISNSPGGGCRGGRALGSPDSLVISADGRHVYVASGASDAVAIFSRNRRTGVLTQPSDARGCVSSEGRGGCTAGRGLRQPTDVALSPDDSNLYVASAGSDAVAVFARGPGGSLSQTADSTACISRVSDEGCTVGRALGGAVALAVARRSVYVASRESDAVAILSRGAGGAVSQAAGRAACVSQAGGGGCAEGRALDGAQDVALSPDGRSVYVAAGKINAVAVFARTTSGRLSQLAGRNGCLIAGGVAGCALGRALSGGSGIAVTRDGRNVYLAAGGRDFVKPAFASPFASFHTTSGLAIFRRTQ